MLQGRNGLVGIATGYSLEDRGIGDSISGRGATGSSLRRTTLGTTQPPIQRAPGVKRLGHETETTRLHINPKLGMRGDIPPPTPTHYHNVVLK
jgi:hypothetical protein